MPWPGQQGPLVLLLLTHSHLLTAAPSHPHMSASPSDLSATASDLSATPSGMSTTQGQNYHSPDRLLWIKRSSIGDCYLEQEQEFLACLDEEEEKIIKEFKKISSLLEKHLDDIQVQRLSHLQDESEENPQSMQDEGFENLQDQRYDNIDDKMLENLNELAYMNPELGYMNPELGYMNPELGYMSPSNQQMKNLHSQIVENLPDQMFENLQENQVDNSPDYGPIRTENIFKVVKKPERIYQTRMGKRNMVDNGPGRIYMTRMGKVNTGGATPQ